MAGRVAKLGDRALPHQEITLDGKPFRSAPPSEPRVLLYHKPVGELVTRSDPQGRPTVFARLPKGRWVAVGRLDINSSGLLLLTDSGELANRLMHPRFGLEREYAARIRGALAPSEQQRLLAGVPLDGVPASFDRIEIQKKGEGANHWYRVVLREGRNRIVRRMFDAIGYKVSRLMRVRFGTLTLPRGLKRGEYIELGPSEVRELSAELGLAAPAAEAARERRPAHHRRPGSRPR